MTLAIGRANVARKNSLWQDEDCGVLEGEREVGRILKAGVEQRRQLATIQFCKVAVMKRL
jgi:hypothetical protein